MEIIRTENITKRFGNLIAVDKISINVREGEIYGFLGLNGAGKTTTIRMLLGMIKPDGGEILLFGKPAGRDRSVWNKVGHLVETPHAYPDLTVRENLKLFAMMRGIGKNFVDEIIEKVRLSQYSDVKAGVLSQGNNQRLGIAKALMHRPALLMLDEPINGLDPAGIVEIRKLLIELSRDEGTTIFLSSHILSEISRLATRIGIVHCGKLVREINAEDLEMMVVKKLLVDTADNSRSLALFREKGYASAAVKDGLLELTEPEILAAPETVAEMLVAGKLPPRMLRIYEEDLEAFFLRTINNNGN